MKKILLASLATISLFLFTACSGKNDAAASENADQSSEASEKATSESSRQAVAASKAAVKASKLAETEKRASVIAAYSATEKAKNTELLSQLMTKLEGTWKNSWEITPIETDYTYYTLSKGGKLNWKHVAVSEVTQGAGMIRFTFPNKLVGATSDSQSAESSSESTTDSSSTDETQNTDETEGAFANLDNSQIEQLTKDIKDTQLDSYLQDFGDESKGYQLQLYDKTGDPFLQFSTNQIFEIKFPASDATIVQMSSLDGSTLFDFKKN